MHILNISELTQQNRWKIFGHQKIFVQRYYLWTLLNDMVKWNSIIYTFCCTHHLAWTRKSYVRLLLFSDEFDWIFYQDKTKILIRQCEFSFQPILHTKDMSPPICSNKDNGSEGDISTISSKPTELTRNDYFEPKVT